MTYTVQKWNNGGRMQDLNDFAWFVQVVDHGGFAAAGGRLISRNQN
jgi:hypothetical protein